MLFSQNLFFVTFLKQLMNLVNADRPVRIFGVFNNLGCKIRRCLILILHDFLLEQIDDLLVMPVVLIKDLTVCQVLDVLHLVVHAPVLEHRIESFRLDANLKNFFSESEAICTILHFDSRNFLEKDL